MNDTSGSDDPPRGESEEFLAFRKRAKAANLNQQTLLATDYLNHFNEIVMTLEMIPDMPEIIEEAREWRPKSYQDHFRDSTFTDKELAIAAYEHVPARYRQPFEVTISTIDQLIAMTLERAEALLAGGEMDRLRDLMGEASRGLQKLMDMASANIHGSDHALDQSEIDDLLDH